VLPMARFNTMRWSGRSQILLARAVADPAFVADMLAHGIRESHLRLWASNKEVPASFRGHMRGRVEDWAIANHDGTEGNRL